MRLFAERLTLLGSLYVVTLSILLTEGVHLGRALAWGAVASTAKFIVVAVHQRLWRSLSLQNRRDG
ncbi:MAG: hypothetical protein KDA88_23585 [Planctomycetaceae bacterium]|nr:hypothetical protein [Planctomycetaceae bacterium]MCB9952141.1 hypothetical protein [Planctomycetaceae bacterium]